MPSFQACIQDRLRKERVIPPEALRAFRLSHESIFQEISPKLQPSPSLRNLAALPFREWKRLLFDGAVAATRQRVKIKVGEDSSDSVVAGFARAASACFRASHLALHPCCRPYRPMSTYRCHSMTNWNRLFGSARRLGWMCWRPGRRWLSHGRSDCLGQALD